MREKSPARRCPAPPRTDHPAREESRRHDPVEHLPDALTKLETMFADKITAELAPARMRIAELERAVKATTIIAWKIDAQGYRLIPFMSNVELC